MSLRIPPKTKYWHYSFQIAGQRFHGSTGTASKTEAKRIEAEVRHKAIIRIKSPEEFDMSLDDAFGKFWEEHAKHKKSSDCIWRCLGVLKDGFGKDKMLRSITNPDIAEYIARRRGETKDGKPVRGNTTVNREVDILRAVLNYATKVWDINLKMPNWTAHRLSEPRGRVRSLTDDEEKRLFAALRPDFHPLVRFCLITGARVSSARNLTWNSINFDTEEIKLEVKSKVIGDIHTLPITPEIKSLLDSVKGNHPIYVFTYVSEGKVARLRQKGKRYPFAKDGWRRTWAKALRDAKITDFRFHDLRHTAATQMLRATKNLAAVKEVLGHSDITMTMRYAHVLTDDKRDALSRKDHRTITGTEDKKDEKTSLKVVVSNG